jgi:hypothetical protein
VKTHLQLIIIIIIIIILYGGRDVRNADIRNVGLEWHRRDIGACKSKCKVLPTVISLVLYGYETSSPTEREEHKLRVSEQKIVRCWA